MVKYYGRSRQRTGSVNTNQIGLKMSGCPSRIGRNPTNSRYIQSRVNCMNGICGIPLQNGAPWRVSPFRNLNINFCKPASNKCLAAAGGIGNINTPYFKTNAPGTKGCGAGGNVPRFSSSGIVLDPVINNPPCTIANFKTKEILNTSPFNACTGTPPFNLVYGEISGGPNGPPALTATYPNIKAIYMGNSNVCPAGTIIIYVNASSWIGGPLPGPTPVAAEFINIGTGQVSIYTFAPGGPPAGSSGYYKLNPPSSGSGFGPSLSKLQAYCVRIKFL